MAAQDSLKVVSIAGRTDAAGAAVADTDQEEFRMPIGALLSPGYLTNMTDQTAHPNAFRVRQDTGANMQVKVGSGTTKLDGYVLRGTVAGQGSYIIRLDAATKTLVVPAADATNPARYGVYAFINDTAYSGTASRAYADISCIRGTPAGSPTTPGPLAAWSAWVLLWEFQLAANATAVTNTILDSGTAFDRRTPAVSPVVPRSGLRSFATSTERDTLVTVPIEGDLAALRNVDRMTIYNGSAWIHLYGYTAASRIGVRVGRLSTVQSIPSSGSSSVITFDTEVADPDGWAPGGLFTTLTVPTGFSGLYHFVANVTWGVDPTIGSNATLTVNGVDYTMSNADDAPTTTLRRLYTATFELAATDALAFKLAHTAAAARDVNVEFNVVRLAI